MPQSLDNLSTNWTSTATLTGIKFNVATDTGPSNAASNLLDLQTGGVSRFLVRRDGQVAAISYSGQTAGFSAVAFHGSVQSSANGAVRDGVGFTTRAANTFSWVSDTNAGSGSIDLILARDDANALAQRNGDNGQIFRVYGRGGGTANFERFFVNAPTTAGAAVQLGTQKGGTGTARALELQTDGTTRLTIGAGGGVTSSAQFQAGTFVTAGATSYLGITSRFFMDSAGSGVVAIYDWAGTSFGRLQFGGVTSSFPALKRDTVRLQARLADDSAFTNIQGKLTADVNAVAETPTATHTITIYDAAGTGYKVLCVAA